MLGRAPVQRGADPLPPLLAQDAHRQVRVVAVGGAAELRGRGGTDRHTIAFRDQVEVVGLAPVLEHDLARHRGLRMHAVADVEIGVDVRVVLDRADGDHGSGP